MTLAFGPSGSRAAPRSDECGSSWAAHRDAKQVCTACPTDAAQSHGLRRRRVNPTIRGMAGGSLLGPDSPDGLASGCPLALFVEQLQRLMQREAVRFAFTRCIHRDWALSDG